MSKCCHLPDFYPTLYVQALSSMTQHDVATKLVTDAPAQVNEDGTFIKCVRTPSIGSGHTVCVDSGSSDCHSSLGNDRTSKTCSAVSSRRACASDSVSQKELATPEERNQLLCSASIFTQHPGLKRVHSLRSLNVLLQFLSRRLHVETSHASRLLL